MLKTKNKLVISLSVLFYLFCVALMIMGTTRDLQIDMALFSPTNRFAIYMEAFGQAVYWAMWGPLFSVLFLCVHSLNENLEIIGRLLPFIKPFRNTEHRAYRYFDRIYQTLMCILFFALADIGWKKLIENVLKNFFELSQIAYFIICAVVAAISIFLFSRLDKKTLNTLESLALAGLLLGICYKLVENGKQITHRVRFREMVAYSNNVLTEEGLSAGAPEGLVTRLKRGMETHTDFRPYTPWYKIGDNMGIYQHSASFPSGHTNYSCTLFLSCLLCSRFDKLKRLAPYAFIISMAYIITMGYSRMLTGAHYLTDVAGGAIIGFTLFLIVAGILNLFEKKNILPTRKLS